MSQTAGYREEELLQDRAPIRAVARRGVIFSQGAPADSVVIVQEGYVKLSALSADGREVTLEIAGPGAWLGEAAALYRWRHAVSAAALSPCCIRLIDSGHFRYFMQTRPEALHAMLRRVSDGQSRSVARAVDALALSARARLAKTLLHVARLRALGPGGCGLALSQSDLGAMTGLSRESVNKYLAAWRAAGWITLSDGLATVIDAGALRAFVSEGAMA